MKSRVFPFLLMLFALPAAAMHHHFHAQVIAIGGDVPTAGAVALSPAGGEGKAVVEHYDANGIRFDQATSSVLGSDDGHVAVTTAMVTLRNIDILGRIQIEEITARVVGRQARNTAEAEITIDNLRLKNVVVDGRHVSLRPDAVRLNKVRTFAALRGRDDAPLPLASALLDDQDQTLVVAGVGTLYFGEVVVKPGERSVTMLRIEFESQHPMRHLTIGTLETNGTELIP